MVMMLKGHLMLVVRMTKWMVVTMRLMAKKMVRNKIDPFFSLPDANIW